MGYVVSTSVIYKSASVYELIMRVLYGRHYSARYRAIAEHIPQGATVLDVCCGPAVLYSRYLRKKQVTYTGLDLQERFVKKLPAQGAQGKVWDLREDTPLPSADIVIMQASLYHFLPDPAPVLDRMLAAANDHVIIAEPVRNMAQSNVRIVAALGRRMTDPGSGEQASRFTEATLDTFLESSPVRQTQLIAGGREKLYVLDAAASRSI